MNKQEYLLSKLAQECCEVAQRCHKAQEFGLFEIQEGQELNNSERILQEYADLTGVFSMLIGECNILWNEEKMDEMTEAKIRKVKKWMEYSKTQGCLHE